MVKKKIVKTHAATVRELFDEQDISIHSRRLCISHCKTQRLTNNLKIVWKQAKQVQLSKDNEKKTIWTTAKTVEEFLKEQSITLNEHDQVQPSLNTAIEKENG